MLVSIGIAQRRCRHASRIVPFFVLESKKGTLQHFMTHVVPPLGIAEVYITIVWV